jgi:hypothetical protein
LCSTPTRSSPQDGGLDARMASFFNENGIAFNIADATSFVRMLEESKKFAVRARLVCWRNWSAHRHIHSKIRNRLELATTEKRVYTYPNTKFVASLHNADELKMFAWDGEDAWAIALIHTASAKQHVPGARGIGARKRPESPSRRVASGCCANPGADVHGVAPSRHHQARPLA